jgi:hypothetical protein
VEAWWTAARAGPAVVPWPACADTAVGGGGCGNEYGYVGVSCGPRKLRIGGVVDAAVQHVVVWGGAYATVCLIVPVLQCSYLFSHDGFWRNTTICNAHICHRPAALTLS